MIIGICGAKGSGKDTAFKILQSNFPDYKIEKIAFADPIKQFLCSMLQINEDQYDTLKRIDWLDFVDHSTNEIILTTSGRTLVREIGMKMRSYDCTQFVKYVQNKVIGNPDTIYVCTDVRFDNEVQFIKQVMRGKLIRIDRAGYQYDNHVTEQKIENVDCVIKNESFDQFTNNLCRWFNSEVAIEKQSYGINYN